MECLISERETAVKVVRECLIFEGEIALKL